MAKEDPYVSVLEAAERLHLSDNRVRQLLREGKLQGKRPGRKWLVPQSEIDRYLDKGTSLPTSSRAEDTDPKGHVVVALATEAHYRELVAFGQRFRDRLFIPHASSLVNSDLSEGPVWSGEPSGKPSLPNRSAEEDAVAREWGIHARTQRRHSLFPLLQSHLDGHPCWQTLEKAENTYQRYLSTSAKVMRLVDRAVDLYLPDLAEWPLGASEVVLKAVLRQVLWLAHPSAGEYPFDIWRLVPVLAPTYPVLLEEVKLNRNAGRFEVHTPRDYRVELAPAVRALLYRDKPLRPSFVKWLYATLSLAELILTWEEQLGPDHALRKSIAKGGCGFCLR